MSDKYKRKLGIKVNVAGGVKVFITIFAKTRESKALGALIAATTTASTRE
ncbi:MAG TPA: hypothetical protein VF540_08890 [Segetibacter sp.]|jgi:hypothetical protein